MDEVPTVSATLDDVARAGAPRMIAAALQSEGDDDRARCRDARDAAGHARVVRNGTARARPVVTGVGPLTRAAPRVNDRRVMAGVRQKFTRALLPKRIDLLANHAAGLVKTVGDDALTALRGAADSLGAAREALTLLRRTALTRRN